MRRLPGRLNAEQTAVLLGISSADIPILMTAKFLVSLGKNIAANAPKYFSAVMVEQMATTPEQMDRMQTILTKHWREKNGARRAQAPVGERNTRRAPKVTQALV